ncbi:MAG: hypothetical protein A2234_06020 [Elusimicrobia bacterium RIFOXYA2_FULL_58_8]|nr:MAG: hypothetical protein A2234_06020 [Elusimicrobia bacterium RIFOXYA2_FULL_58_8]OGS13379.1 MAG: hypothetical protein A2285_05310 [Elusimicrobia bacterium RIFOXYA12_FULL_57_11]
MTFNRFLLTCALALAAAYSALAFHPDALFPNTYRFGNVALHSREPISESARALISRVNEKIFTGDFSSAEQNFDIYIPGSKALYTLFAPFCAKTFACLHPVTDKIFIFSADFGKNLASIPGGMENPRMLESVLTHELVKAQLKHALGTFNYIILPGMKKDGYAEHIVMETAEMQPAEICVKNKKTATLALYLEQRLALELVQFENDITYPALLRSNKADGSAEKRLRQKYCN